MGGLIVIFMFVMGFALGIYFVLRKILFKKNIPRDIANDDLIGGILNLGIMIISFVCFSYLINYFVPDTKKWLRVILILISIYPTYLIIVLVNRILSSDK